MLLGILRQKSPLKCLFGLQNLDSDRLKRQNRHVKLESILTSFDKFTLLFACHSLFFVIFHPSPTNLYNVQTDLPWFRRFSDRYAETTWDFGRVEAESRRRRRVGENDGFSVISTNFRWFLTYGDLENGLIIASTSYSRDHGLLITHYYRLPSLNSSAICIWLMLC